MVNNAAMTLANNIIIIIIIIIIMVVSGVHCVKVVDKKAITTKFGKITQNNTISVVWTDEIANV